MQKNSDSRIASYQTLLKGLVSFSLGFGLAIILKNVNFEYLDTLFLDLRQFVFQPDLQESNMVFVNVSATKDEQSTIASSKFQKAIEQLLEENPKKIVIAMSPVEIRGNAIEVQALVDFLRKDSRIYLYSSWGEKDGESFNDLPPWSEFPRLVYNQIAVDNKLGGYDNRVRRLVLSMDRKILDPDLENLQRSLELQVRSLNDYRNSFSLLGSEQIYLRFYSKESIPTILLSQVDPRKKVLEGKLLFVGSHDHHSSMTHKSISGRFAKEGYTSYEFVNTPPTYIINSLENLNRFDYVKTPSFWIDVFWMGLFISINIFLLLVLPPTLFIPISVIYPLGVGLLNFSIFAFSNFNFDITRVVLCGLVIQFLGIPVLLLRHLRRLDAEKLQMEKEREADRVKSRFIIKVAKADLSLQMAAKVSHDIRSPLMALQVANSVIKGKVSEDLESLLRESTSRLKYIADDLLDSYRTGKNPISTSERSEVKELIDELLNSYRQLYVGVTFKLEVAEGLYTYIPRYSLQRCLSNLLNNSVEALPDSKGFVSIEVLRVDEGIVIRVKDDGKGVPSEFQKKLFQVRASFGKASGTGLGLYQIRKELENYGGRIHFEPQVKGSCFVISLPETLAEIPLAVSKNILVVESGNEMYSLLGPKENSKFNFHQEKTIQGVLGLIADSGTSSFWTIFVDLSLSDEESGFDLIEKLGSDFSGKVILCTAFADNMEVQEMANRYNALLLNKSLLSRLNLQEKL